MKRYIPLIVIVIFAVLAAVFLSFNQIDSNFMSAMINFAGLFFLFLSAFKCFDLEGFVEGFSKYDLLAQKSRGYAFIYPFIELVIALSFLSRFFLVYIAFFTALLMFFSLLGVLKALRENKELSCACMGTKLNLPLTTVSVIENGLMGAMSLVIAFFDLP